MLTARPGRPGLRATPVAAVPAAQRTAAIRETATGGLLASGTAVAAPVSRTGKRVIRIGQMVTGDTAADRLVTRARTWIPG
jgi:hypothetical protein